MATLVVGENTYGTEAEADSYFADRYGYDKWATESNKSGALVSATQILDLMAEWYYEKCDPEQLLEFPRTNDCPNIPTDIKNAQFEIAYQVIDRGSAIYVQEDSITELKAGSVTLKFKATSSKNPFKTDLVISLISPYGLVLSAGPTQIIPMEWG